jgi:uncharacterized phage protein (TIGR02218 family)
MNSLIYMFNIKLKDGKESHLTSSSVPYKIGNINYLPNSGLNFVFGEFNESAHNHVCIKGVFEQNGIEKDDNLAGAEVKISRLKDKDLIPFISYICTKYITKDLEFEIWCEPETVKYNQSLLQMFSKTCRANFSDDKCKIPIEKYALKTEVVEVTGNILRCNIQGFNNGYFKNGVLLAVKENGSKYEFRILTHHSDRLKVNLTTEFDFEKHKLVTLIPGCDKNYRTCCYSFNNAVNFRGEPVIPESNIIEN